MDGPVRHGLDTTWTWLDESMAEKKTFFSLYERCFFAIFSTFSLKDEAEKMEGNTEQITQKWEDIQEILFCVSRSLNFLASKSQVKSFGKEGLTGFPKLLLSTNFKIKISAVQ